MTTLRQAAQQALEALDCPGKAKTADEQAAITALRAALAEPVQEPVQEAEELKDPAEYDDFAAAIRHNERVTTRRYAKPVLST